MIGVQANANALLMSYLKAGRLHHKFHEEAVSDCHKHPEDWRSKFKMKSNRKDV